MSERDSPAADRLAVLSGVVYLVSFLLPITSDGRFGGGLSAFLMAPALAFEIGGVFSVLLSVAWLANPLSWFGLFRWWHRRPRDAAGAGAWAALLGLLTLPTLREMGSPSPAFLAWWASFAMLLAAGALASRRTARGG